MALISPIPDAMLALVAAGELAYLGLLSTHPKFQASVEAQEAKQALRRRHGHGTASDGAHHFIAAERFARSLSGTAGPLPRPAANRRRTPTTRLGRFANAAGELPNLRARSAAVDSPPAVVHAIRPVAIFETNQRRPDSLRHQALRNSAGPDHDAPGRRSGSARC